MNEYVVVNRELVTAITDLGAQEPDIVRSELMTVIQVMTQANKVESWGAYRGMVMNEHLSYAEVIDWIVQKGHALQKHEAFRSIRGKPLGWDLENCRYDNGLFK